MSEAVSQPFHGNDATEHHLDIWVPYRLLNTTPREHRFDISVDFPNILVKNIDRMAVDLFDPRGSNVLIIGHERVGKTFLVEQLIGNQQKYTDTEHYFIELHESDLRVILDLDDRFTSFAEIVAQQLEVDEEQIIFVTGNNAIATSFAATKSPRKMIFEAQVGAYQRIMIEDDTYENGIWSNWSVFDANDIHLTKEELIDLLFRTQQQTNRHAPTKKQVESLVERFIQRRPSLLERDTVKAPAGLFAGALRRASGLMKHTTSQDFKTAKGNQSWSKISQDVVENFLDEFDPFTKENAAAGISSQIEQLIQDMMGDPSEGPKQIIISSGTQPGLETQTAKAPEGRSSIEWNDMSTLADRMKQKVFGQDETIDAIANELMVAATGLSDENKPLGSFLLMGPTGVGKTMIAQTLQEELIVGGMNMLRLDMSEYGEKFEAAKLFGVPPGYVGFDEGGILTNAIQKNPRTLILLDEVEKAHPLVWDAFLQVFDAGRMTTATGEVVDFSQTVIVLTSNLGTREMSRGASGFSPSNLRSVGGMEQQERHAISMAAAKDFFRPEMINRIDSIFTVNPLKIEVAEKILTTELNILFDRSGLVIQEPSQDVLDILLNKSNIDEYGARDIKRVVRKEIAVQLSQAILQHGDKEKAPENTFTLAADENGDIYFK